MAKEKFLIIASRMEDDCFGRFSETENRGAISAGTADHNDPYSWIEASFEIILIRYREATHLCSFTPSAYGIWLQNAFAGQPNEAWDCEGDPEGLELESGQTSKGDYYAYHDDYDPRFICETFTVDTMRDLEEPMRFSRSEAYHDAIWNHAEEVAWDLIANGAAYAPILDAYTFRQWEQERLSRVRERSLALSRMDADRALILQSL